MANMIQQENFHTSFDFGVNRKDGSSTEGSVYITHDLRITLCIKQGQLLTFLELFSVIAGIKPGFSALSRALEFKRSNPYKIEVWEGEPGWIDLRLISAKNIGNFWVKELKSNIHVSMLGKVNFPEHVHGMFLPDLAAFYREYNRGSFDLVEAGLHHKSSETFQNMVNVNYDKPSILTSIHIGEDGWRIDN